MKILHIAPHIDEGGVQTMIYEMSTYQASQGHDVSILSLLKDKKYYSKEMDYEANGVKIIHGEYDKVYDPRHIRVIKKYLKDFDIVHIHNFPNQLFSKIAFSLTSKKNRPVLITTEHNTHNNRRDYKALRYLDRWFYKCYDRIISISPQTEINLNEWLKSEKIRAKILTITNGVNLERIKKAENKLPQLIRKENGDVFVVMVSRMEHPKDPVTLVRAIAECDNKVHGIFIGSGPLEDEVRNTAESLGISDRIHVLGGRKDVAELIKGCDIGVLSTLWDGFGLVSVEYMAAGLPVIATDVDGLRDVIGRKDTLFSYGDYLGLRDIIMHLVKNQEAYNEQKEYSLNRCEKFSIMKMNEEYLDTYKLLTETKV